MSRYIWEICIRNWTLKTDLAEYGSQIFSEKYTAPWRLCWFAPDVPTTKTLNTKQYQTVAENIQNTWIIITRVIKYTLWRAHLDQQLDIQGRKNLIEQQLIIQHTMSSYLQAYRASRDKKNRWIMINTFWNRILHKHIDIKSNLHSPHYIIMFNGGSRATPEKVDQEQ